MGLLCNAMGCHGNTTVTHGDPMHGNPMAVHGNPMGVLASVMVWPWIYDGNTMDRSVARRNGHGFTMALPWTVPWLRRMAEGLFCGNTTGQYHDNTMVYMVYTMVYH